MMAWFRRWRVAGPGLRSLYLRIYLTVVVVLLVFALVAAVLVHRHADAERGRIEMAVSERTLALASLLHNSLPAVTAPLDEQRIALLDWSRRLRLPLALDDAQGTRIAVSPFYARWVGGGRVEEDAMASRVPLSDGRVLWVLRQPGIRSRPREHGSSGMGYPSERNDRLDEAGGSEASLREALPGRDRLSAPVNNGGFWRLFDWPGKLFTSRGLVDDASILLGLLGVLFVAVTVGAYPVVRRLTRRLEALKRGVEQFGSGDLGHRVDARGRDEVAAVAASFNRAAQRIEDLVRSNRSLLANASHELRSPLARLKMAVAMSDGASEERRSALKREIDHDIRELDSLVEEVLLASRLDAQVTLHREPIDLLGLLAEEAARVGAAADGDSVQCFGEERLLRRALRNLLENARRYGGDEVEAHVVQLAGGAIEVQVCDRGPGVPAAYQERVFEPFFRLPGHAERAGGVGLGLSLVRQIAARHGGQVLCLAREGGGSSFVLRLPAQGARPSRLSAGHGPHSG